MAPRMTIPGPMRRRDISAQLISLLQIAVRHCTVA